ncbi:hypothetical protein [Micromonospora sp. DT231]|uniref:hypothetical protein n=1 Tax=Micromonospora sp. DT231 TaxID=3416526 RepID=UPI003CE6BFD3
MADDELTYTPGRDLADRDAGRVQVVPPGSAAGCERTVRIQDRDVLSGDVGPRPTVDGAVVLLGKVGDGLSVQAAVRPMIAALCCARRSGVG